jgi:hypothetical protein
MRALYPAIPILLCLVCTSAEAGWAEARQDFQASALACNQRFPSGNPKTAMNRGRCLDSALTIISPYVKNQDLLQYFMAQRMAIVERYATGKATQAQTNAAIAEVAAKVTTEERRRNEASALIEGQRRAALAQERASAAQARAADAQEDSAMAAQFGMVTMDARSQPIARAS